MKNKRVRLKQVLRERVSEEEQQATDKPINIGQKTNPIMYPLRMIKMTQKIYDCDFTSAKKILLDKRRDKLIRYELNNLSNE